MMLSRAEELEVAGCRPSAYARVRVAAKKDGTLTAWDSFGWGTGGPGGGGSPPIPYLIRDRIPNYHIQWTAVVNNIGPARAWRAPNHPQACLITMAALDDLAHKLGMNPLEFFKKNIELTGPRANIYMDEFPIADELMGWSKRWHPRGDKASGSIKQGLGMSMHTWGGRGHQSECDVTIQPDGSVTIKMGTQDLGTGTRTAILAIAADTLGLTPQQITLLYGDTRYPMSGGSGGSTTIGGVSSTTRRASVDARDALFVKVAPALGSTPEQLEVVKGQVRVKGQVSRTLSWKEACAKMGAIPINAHGKNLGGRDPLMNSGVGGVQMADVSVDIETGIVRINKMVAVQDCGLIVSLETAESQCYGALIMGISYALYEEKVMDPTSGRMLNPNMEFYRLAGIGDIGELVVHMMSNKYDNRGVIGLGEPPVVSPGAAISNAVANAIGVRVPMLPLTASPRAGCIGRAERGKRMIQFEYVSPNSVKQALGLLSANLGDTEVLAGGTDLLGLMKDFVLTPKRVVNIKHVSGLEAIRTERDGGVRIGALVTLDRIIEASHIRQYYPALAQTVADAASPQIRNMATIGGNLCQRPRCWYFRNGMGLLPKTPDGKSMVVNGDNRYHAILGNEGPANFVSPSTIAPMLIAYRARVRITGPDGERELPLEKFFRVPTSDGEREHDLKPNELVTEVVVPPAKNVRASQLRSASENIL